MSNLMSNLTSNLTGAMKRACLFVYAVVLTSLLQPAPIAYAQTTRHVSVVGNDLGGANTCTDSAFACRTIAQALDVSADGDTIDLAAGVYTEVITIDKSVAILGAGPGATIVQAHAQSGQATERVITIEGELSVEISHLSIRHGNATGMSPKDRGGAVYVVDADLSMNDVALIDNSADSGGAMMTLRSSPVLTDVTFADNTSRANGGAMFNDSSSPVLNSVTFTDNQSLGTVGSGHGGAIYNRNNSSPMFTDVAFVANVATEDGGAMYSASGSAPVMTGVVFEDNEAVSGGAMFNASDSLIEIIDADFVDNDAIRGGALYNDSSSPLLTRVRFTENHAVNGGAVANVNGSSPQFGNVAFVRNKADSFGGALWNQTVSSPSLHNVVFFANEAGRNGGAMDNGFDSSPVIVNTTFAANTALERGGAMVNFGGSLPVVSSTILWGNSAGAGNEIYNFDNGAGTELRYCIYRDGSDDVVPGSGLIIESSLTSDPLFLDAPGGNLRLQGTSPAINAGDPGPDLSSFLSDSIGFPIDHDGNARLVGNRIDIGAFEWSDLDTGTSEALAARPGFRLGVPYPNPTSGIALVSIASQQARHIRIQVFDALGRRVRALFDGVIASGVGRELTIDTSALPTGVYFVRANDDSSAQTRTLTVAR